MGYFKAILFLFLVGYSGATSLTDIANSLQSVEKMLTNLKKENDVSQTNDMNGLKAELKLYIDEQVSKNTDKRLNDDRVVRALIVEKKLRKQLEEKVNVIQEDLKCKEVTIKEEMVKVFQEDLKRKEATIKEEMFKVFQEDLKRREVTIKEEMIKVFQEDLKRKEETIKNLENKLEDNKKEDTRRDAQLASGRTDLDNFKVDVRDFVQEVMTFKDKTRLLQDKFAVIVEDIDDKIKLARETCDNSVEKAKRDIAESYSVLDHRITDTYSQLLRTRPAMVAFSARIEWRNPHKDLKPWQIIVFGDVSLNIGQGYSKTTGMFTAPVKGVYVFHVHISGGDNKALEISLQKNPSNVLFLYVKGPGHGNDSAATTLYLEKGDVVKVVKHGPWGQRPFYVHPSFSSFSGFLLYEG